MTRRLAAALGAFAILSCTAPPPAPSGPMAPARFDAATVAKGARLAAMGNCVSCHTAQGGKPFAGGYALKTQFRTQPRTNIPPDPQTGLGSSTLENFTRALRPGLSPLGRHYY